MAIETLSWVYQLSDFDTSGSNITPPDEQGANAQGSPPFDITLSNGASPFQIELDDGSNDGFDEVNANSSDQLLTQPITLDNVTYPVGTRIFVNYVLETDDGFRLYSITLDGSNTGRNDTTAAVTNGPMVPGQQYTFTSEGNIGQGEVDYADIACFAAGTRIETVTGMVAVEELCAGDLVVAWDGSALPLRSALQTTVSACDMVQHPKLAPVRISQGALGNGLPRRDLLVSRQHRMLVCSKVAERMFGAASVMVAAIRLTELPGIYVDHDVTSVTYFHLVFDTHEVINAEGAPSESFFVDPYYVQGMTPATQAEILQLFPQLMTSDTGMKPACPIPRNGRQKRLIERHMKNNKDVLQLCA